MTPNALSRTRRRFRPALSVHEWGVLALLLATMAAVAVVSPSFLAPSNLRDIFVNSVPPLIVACGLTFVILTGEIDISMGSLMGLLAAVMGVLVSPDRAGWPVAAGVAVTLLLGTTIGFLNGFLVAVGRVPSIIVSLGLLVALRGVSEVVMQGTWVTDLPPGLRWFGTARILGIDVAVWAAAAVIAVSLVIAHATPLGRRIYAVGSSPTVARLTGISQTRIKLFVFTYTGFLVALATLVSVPRLSVVESGIGKGFELLAVTCVVVGGTAISGGRGTLFGSILGALLMTMIGTVLIFLRLGEHAVYWEQAIRGLFILAAVLSGHFARRGVRREAVA